MPDSAEKTEEATPKRKRDARKKGQVFSSQDIINLASMLAGYAIVRYTFPSIVDRLFASFSYFSDLAVRVTTLDDSWMRDIALHTAVLTGAVLLPVLLVTASAAIIATGVQTRFLFSGESMRPKFERLNPLQGLKRMVSLRGIVELLKNLAKISIIGVIIYRFILGHDIMFGRMLDMGVEAATAYFLSALFSMLIQICMFFGIIAFADFMYQRYDYNKNLRMSKQEIKEEYRQEEGDPQIKSRVREVQRRMASSRMMQQVPGADVIIRNPTHYAIAIKYNAEKDVAPRVVAKGTGEMALRIVRTGEEAGVFIQEDPELARAIYPLVEIGDLIPYDFYNAIADLLALVYRMRSAPV